MVCGVVTYSSKKEAFDVYLLKGDGSGFAGALGIVHCDKLMHVQVPSVALFQPTS